MVNRSRLSRTGIHAIRDARLRSQLSSEIRGLPTARLKKYATMASSLTTGNPVLSETKLAARIELANCNAQLSQWSGASKSARFKKGVSGFLNLAGMGVKIYVDVLSGTAQQNMFEDVATMGMKPKQRAAEKKRLRREWVKSLRSN